MKKFLAAAVLAATVAIAAVEAGFGGGQTYAEVPACDHCHVMSSTGWWQYVCTKCGYKGTKFQGKNPNNSAECFTGKKCGGLMTSQDCAPPG